MFQSNLAARLATAIVVLPLVLWLLFRGPEWAWCGLVVVIAVLGALELFGMTHPGDRVAQYIGAGSTLAVSLTLYSARGDLRWIMSVFLGGTLLGVLVPLWRLGDINTAALRMFAGVTGPFYVGALLSTIMLLRRDFGASGPSLVFLTLSLGWLGDTGGYAFGRLFGKTKLYPAVSPKKTVAGFFGSLLCATLGALGISLWLLPSLPLAHAVGLGICGGALGQFGDLVESLLKRSTGVKDSGTLIPGHGGVLDRIDAILVVAPFVYLYSLWC